MNAIAQGWVTNSLAGLACWATAKCRLIVCPASVWVLRLITDSRLCVLTLKRTGPLGDAPVLGRKAKLPLIATLASWLGYAPVGKVKAAPGAMRASASPAALKPLSASGCTSTSWVTVSLPVLITVTCPALASSAPSTLPATGSDRNCVTYRVSSLSDASPLLLTARPRGSKPTPAMILTTVSVAVSMTEMSFDLALATYSLLPLGVSTTALGSVPTFTCTGLPMAPLARPVRMIDTVPLTVLAT